MSQILHLQRHPSTFKHCVMCPHLNTMYRLKFYIYKGICPHVTNSTFTKASITFKHCVMSQVLHLQRHPSTFKHCVMSQVLHLQRHPSTCRHFATSKKPQIIQTNLSTFENECPHVKAMKCQRHNTKYNFAFWNDFFLPI